MTKEFKEFVVGAILYILWVLAIFLFIPTLGWAFKLFERLLEFCVDKGWVYCPDTSIFGGG